MSSNKTILKNSLFLYFRLFFTLGIGLYTSRIVINVLGVEDFGIYNLVGGFVALFAFLQGALGGATSRFLNVAMTKSIYGTKITFNTAIILHLILAILVLLLSETVGLWFFYNKLNIPSTKVNIAFWVYQMSIFTTILTIIQIPYNALIIAKERMKIFAYFSITEAVIKLGIIFIVGILDDGRLLYYAFFMLLLSVISRLSYQIYCSRNFPESKFKFLFDKKSFKQMSTFFGWDLYGNLSVIAKIQGTNVLQNMFFGATVNASIAIASQLQGGISSLGSNFTLASRPQLIKSYANKDFVRLNEILFQGTRLGFYFLLLISLPLAINSEYIIQIWLGQQPKYAADFLQLTLLSGILSIVFTLVIPLIHATGKMFLISFLTGTVYLISLPITFLFFKLNYSPIFPYFLNFIVIIVSGLCNIWIVNQLIPEIKIYQFFKRIVIKLIFHLIVITTFIYFLKFQLNVKPIYSLILTAVLVLIFILLVGINKEERSLLISKIKSKL